MQTRRPYAAAAQAARQAWLGVVLGASLAPPVAGVPPGYHAGPAGGGGSCPITVTFYSRIDPDGSTQLHYRWVRADGTRAGITTFTTAPGADRPDNELSALAPRLLAPVGAGLMRAVPVPDCTPCAMRASCADLTARASLDSGPLPAGGARGRARTVGRVAGGDGAPLSADLLYADAAPGDCDALALARRFAAAPAPCLTQ